jgi:hypothetical protein
MSKVIGRGDALSGPASGPCDAAARRISQVALRSQPHALPKRSVCLPAARATVNARIRSELATGEAGGGLVTHSANPRHSLLPEM